MNRLLTLLRGLVYLLALLLLAAGGVLVLVEESGLLERNLQDRLAAQLGETIALDGAELKWFEPALELEGLAFGAADGGLRLEHVRIGFGRSRGYWAAERVEISGGQVVLSPELIARLRRLRGEGELDSRETVRAAREAILPDIVLEGVQVDLSHPDWGEIPIGLVDAVCVSEGERLPVLQGRVVPSLAPRSVGGPQPEVYLSGSELEGGVLEIRASAEDVPVSVDALPIGTALDPFCEFSPRGRLTLDGELRISLDGTRPPEGLVRAALRGGSFVPPTTETPIEDLFVDVEARLVPDPGDDPFDPMSWESTTRLRADWKGTAIRGWALVGRNVGPHAAAEGWVHAREVPLALETLAACGLEAAIPRTWEALDPRGRADVAVALALPHGEGARPALSVGVECDGDTGVTYVGYPNRDGVHQGVTLPVEDVSGRVQVLFDPRQPRVTRIGWWGAEGTHHAGTPDAGRAFGEGLVISALGPERAADFDLSYGGEAVPVDDSMRVALEGLSGTEFIWPSFSPTGGRVSFEARMVKTTAARFPAGSFAFRLEDVAAEWSEAPAPLRELGGDLHLTFDARGGFAASVDLAGRTATSDRAVIRGRIQEDARLQPSERYAARVQAFDVALEGVSLRGADREALAETLPGLERSLVAVAPAGKVDVAVRTGRSPEVPRMEIAVEVEPRVVRLSPQAFQVQTSDVRGRVVVAGEMASVDEPARLEARAIPIAGQWPGGTRVAANMEFPPDGEGTLRLFGAGIDLTNLGLLGAFRAAIEGGDPGSGGPPDLGAFTVGGRVDFRGDWTIEEGGGTRSTNRVHLRDNDLSSGEDERYRLSGLRGVLMQRDRTLYGEEIAARLGATDIVLRDARFSVGPEGTVRLETRPEAKGLPLDAEHMRIFLDEDTLTALVEELEWRGEIDIEEATLTFTGSKDTGLRVDFRGRVTPRDMSIDMGLPLEIESASVEIERLVFEGGSVRAWASVADLDGSLAGRRLTAASMELTFVEPHLSILDLDGRLESGWLRHLGSDEVPGGPAFSMDLEAPFPFDLGMRMESVDVGALLRGLFESDFMSRGTVSGDMRLTGSLERVTDIRGDGSVELEDSNLWSIPVMRGLFSQLGFDRTAVFERMRARFRVQDGVIQMTGMDVSSPLLKLVGSGTLDLDGRLSHDLQVRYGLVDRLGPLTRLVYWVQNNLLSVSIRGDMARPKIVLEGALSFLQSETSQERDLPLPGFAPLPERF